MAFKLVKPMVAALSPAAFLIAPSANGVIQIDCEWGGNPEDDPDNFGCVISSSSGLEVSVDNDGGAAETAFQENDWAYFMDEDNWMEVPPWIGNGWVTQHRYLREMSVSQMWWYDLDPMAWLNKTELYCGGSC